MTKCQLHVLLTWRKNAMRAAQGHYKECERYHFRGKWYGIGILVSSISVLFFANSENAVSAITVIFQHLSPKFLTDIFTAIGATNGNLNDDQHWVNSVKFFVSIAGLLTVVLASIQQVRNYKELAWRHKIAANEYSNLKRKIERYIATFQATDLKEHVMHAMSKDYFHITKASPTIKAKTWQQVLNPKPTLLKKLSEKASKLFIKQKTENNNTR